jgi:hypothetical protein
MILCLLEDAQNISVGFKCNFGSKHFEVIAKNDVQNYGVACDISLKEVDIDGE